LFIVALLAGSLLPLAIMYIILSPNKLKNEWFIFSVFLSFSK
jgi:hypothetical protein